MVNEHPHFCRISPKKINEELMTFFSFALAKFAVNKHCLLCFDTVDLVTVILHLLNDAFFLLIGTLPMTQYMLDAIVVCFLRYDIFGHGKISLKSSSKDKKQRYSMHFQNVNSIFILMEIEFFRSQSFMCQSYK